ncbi:MAG: MoaD/ThiS family protein [Pirellulales bacterium]|jgi:molybdopterin converting factor small subunit
MDRSIQPSEPLAAAAATEDVPPGTVVVELFAGMAELVGCRRVSLAWGGGDVAALRGALARACPAAAPLLERSAVAIGDRYAAEDQTVDVGHVVAVIPPVSGG